MFEALEGFFFKTPEEKRRKYMESAKSLVAKEIGKAEAIIYEQSKRAPTSSDTVSQLRSEYAVIAQLIRGKTFDKNAFASLVLGKGTHYKGSVILQGIADLQKLCSAVKALIVDDSWVQELLDGGNANGELPKLEAYIYRSMHSAPKTYEIDWDDSFSVGRSPNTSLSVPAGTTYMSADFSADFVRRMLGTEATVFSGAKAVYSMISELRKWGDKLIAICDQHYDGTGYTHRTDSIIDQFESKARAYRGLLNVWTEYPQDGLEYARHIAKACYR